MKKIIITIKEKKDDKTKSSVNVKLEDSKTASENENITASNVYNTICTALQNLEK